MKRACGECMYFLQTKGNQSDQLDDAIGECRRHAPRPVVMAVNDDDWRKKAYEPFWPEVFGSEWCGDYKPK